MQFLNRSRRPFQTQPFCDSGTWDCRHHQIEFGDAFLGQLELCCVTLWHVFLTLLFCLLWMAVIWALLLGILCSDVWYSAYVVAHHAHQQNKAVSLIMRVISDEIIESQVMPRSLTVLGQGLGIWLLHRAGIWVTHRGSRSAWWHLPALLTDRWTYCCLTFVWQYNRVENGVTKYRSLSRCISQWGSTRWQWNNSGGTAAVCALIASLQMFLWCAVEAKRSLDVTTFQCSAFQTLFCCL